MAVRMIVALVFPLKLAAGTSRWTSENESEELAADVRSSSKTFSTLQAINRSSRVVDLMLSRNISVEEIIKQTIAHRERENGTLADLHRQKNLLEQDEKIRSEKEAALRRATAKASLASAARKQAKQACEGAKHTVIGKVATKQNAEAALEDAKRHLEDVVQDTLSSDVLAANSDLIHRTAKLKAAEEELAQAESNKTARATALTEAIARSSRLEARRQEAQEAFASASAEVTSVAGTLGEIRKEARPALSRVEKLNQSLEEQTSVVEALRSQSASLHEKLDAAQKKYTELQEVLKEDSGCKHDLQQAEARVRHASTSYNLTIAAYQASPHDPNLLGSAWDSIDELENATYQKYLRQKACAPEGVDIPPRTPPAPCGKDTGGTCRVLWCDASRGAYCDWTYACLCAGATCARDGVCRPRGPPATAPRPRRSPRRRPPPARSGSRPPPRRGRRRRAPRPARRRSPASRPAAPRRGTGPCSRRRSGR
mmetsp:Transcript_121064/g.328525  ORF Transcript_121064/g.328525 Transcript_121064/m.328525 type:complete len:485 (-) Transcript_121064:108-1562(-)